MVTARGVNLLVQREIALGHGRQLAAAADKRFPPNLIDKIAAVSPSWQSRRAVSRMGQTILAGGYDITQSRRTRRQRGNRLADGSADNAQDDQTLWHLRELCRDHDRNSSLLHGIIERATDNITGPEFGFRPHSGDEAFDRDAAALLTEASAAAEFRGLFNLQGIIRFGMRSLYPDGDFLVNYLKNGQLQIIEAHDLVTPIGGKGYRDRRVVGGVELDDSGRHRAYYVRDPRQANEFGYSGWISSHQKAQRLDAAHARLVANRHRFSQTRGVPILAPCLDMFDSLDGYLDSEMLAAKLDADRVWYIKRPGATESLPGTDTQTDPNSSSDSETTYEKLLRSEPGMILDLGDGEDVGSTGGDRPGDTFQPYVITVIRMIGACVSMPLELVLLDFSQTNYSSARAALLQAYRSFMYRQNFGRDNIIQPTYNRWVDHWIAAGQLKPVPNAHRLMFYPPRWAWIDPLKEVLALEKKISAGAGTLSQWIAEEGKIVEDIFAIRQSELEALRRATIPTTTAPNNLPAAEETA